VFARAESITDLPTGMFLATATRHIRRVPYLAGAIFPVDPAGLTRYVERRFAHYPPRREEQLREIELQSRCARTLAGRGKGGGT